MRLLEEIILLNSTLIPDGYGGMEEVEAEPQVIEAATSIGQNELRLKSSGMGFYRILTLVVEKDSGVDINSEVEHRGVKYLITREVNRPHPFQQVFVGHEI